MTSRIAIALSTLTLATAGATTVLVTAHHGTEQARSSWSSPRFARSSWSHVRVLARSSWSGPVRPS